MSGPGAPTQAAVDFAVLSNIIVDDVVLADGTERLGLLGGAATYAAAGIRCWSNRVGLVCGMGDDFAGAQRRWFEVNGFDLQGVTARHAHSPRSWVRYAADGERVETPQYGIDHFRLMEPNADQIPATYLGARGLYIFRTHSPAFWASLRALPAPPAGVILWEIAADAALPDLRPIVAQVLPLVDILSINRAEARGLYGVTSPRDALHAALKDGARVVALRLGPQGSLVTDGASLLEVPAAPAQVVDVTGGGNAFSGGFLAGYCGAAEVEGDPLERAARCGAAAAALAIDQYGPPPVFDDPALCAARRRADALPILRSTFH